MTRNNGTWQKGQSGNPGGRPKKGYSITEYMRDFFDKNPATLETIRLKLVGYATMGDLPAIKLIWSYMDGIPAQHQEFTNKGLLPTIGVKAQGGSDN